MNRLIAMYEQMVADNLRRV